MKILRYIILLEAIVIIQKPLSAQTLASDPSMTTFRSTSTMSMSGSTLISSQDDNGYVNTGIGRPRRVGGNTGQQGEPEEPGSERPDPEPIDDPIDDNPIGAVPLLLMTLLAAGYGVGKSKVE